MTEFVQASGLRDVLKNDRRSVDEAPGCDWPRLRIFDRGVRLPGAHATLRGRLLLRRRGVRLSPSRSRDEKNCAPHDDCIAHRSKNIESQPGEQLGERAALVGTAFLAGVTEVIHLAKSGKLVQVLANRSNSDYQLRYFTVAKFLNTEKRDPYHGAVAATV